MSLAKLYASMALTIMVVTVVSLLLFMGLLYLLNYSVSLQLVLGFIVAVYVIQWLLAPYIIDALYHVRPVKPGEMPWLENAVREISMKSGIEPPKLVVAEIDIPNAFAYGTPFSGYKVAVTRGLLEILPKDEVVAVVGHEIGHIKHRDVVVIMLVGLIPTIIAWLGNYLLRWGWLIGWESRREGGSLTPLAAVALGAFLVFIGFILNLGVLYLSRLREYYADSHSAMTVPGGSRKLMRALARIMLATGYLKKHGVHVERYGQLKTLFISSLDHAFVAHGYSDIDAVVEELKRMKPSLLEELFSTHPHPAKRFRFLESLALA